MNKGIFFVLYSITFFGFKSMFILPVAFILVRLYTYDTRSYVPLQNMEEVVESLFQTKVAVDMLAMPHNKVNTHIRVGILRTRCYESVDVF